jgi:hypothetical protein
LRDLIDQWPKRRAGTKHGIRIGKFLQFRLNVCPDSVGAVCPRPCKQTSVYVMIQLHIDGHIREDPVKSGDVNVSGMKQSDAHEGLT